MIRRVVVLGGGSAGFLAALALKSKLPNLEVTVIRSKEIGIIGVGEGSTPGLTRFLHDYLKVDHGQFLSVAQPTWKLGLRFLWGPRQAFHFSFNEAQLLGRSPVLPRARAAYAWDDMGSDDPISALMSYDRVFERNRNGAPVLHPHVAYHFENEKFVNFLESYAALLGIAIRDDTVTAVDQNEAGIAALHLASGATEVADLFVDASGFTSLLLAKTLGEPFIGFERTLFCDRAIAGGWKREDPAEQIIKPYTTCETMDSGWCWQIEHEHRINRGYVYSSAFISDDQAEKEFRAKNPRIGPTRIVKFTSGRYRDLWVKNVVAMGNAGGFVEPLEATALGAIALQSKTLVDSLVESNCEVTPGWQNRYNHFFARFWDEIRNFLSVHYKCNTRLDTPFWKHCRDNTDLGEAASVLELYREIGPSFWLEDVIDRASQFRAAGYVALLTGQKVEYRRHPPTETEMQAWKNEQQRWNAMASRALSVNETLAIVRSPQWQWNKPL